MPSRACASLDQRERRERDLVGERLAEHRGTFVIALVAAAPRAAQSQIWPARKAGSPRVSASAVSSEREVHAATVASVAL